MSCWMDVFADANGASLTRYFKMHNWGDDLKNIVTSEKLKWHVSVVIVPPCDRIISLFP